MIKIIEQYRNSKNGDLSNCEDIIFTNSNFVAVIDGATSKSEKRWDGKTSGQMSALLIEAELEKLSPDITAAEAMKQLNNAIFKWYESEGNVEQMRSQAVERATSSIVMCSVYRKQVWLLGDSQFMIDENAFTNPKPVDILFENLRAFYLEIEVRNGKTVEELLEHDTGRELIQPLIAKQTQLQNVSSTAEFAYDVLDGFFENEHSIKVYDLPANAREIILASDGYPYLRSTLTESEQELQTLLQQDPLCYQKFRSTKGLKKGNISFDDRSYIRFSVN
jgi:hypothetical protein